MNRAALDIGNLRLDLVGGRGVANAMALPGMSKFQTDGCEPTLTLMLDTMLSQPECRPLHRFTIMEGEEECLFSVDNDGVYYYTFNRGGVLRIDPRTPDLAECSEMVSPDKLRFAIWLAYGMLGAHHGRLPIHASAVVHRGRVVLCLGESGTGKSTHTRLWMENIPHCHLLNDDSPILSVSEGTLMVYGSPWSGKTPCYLNECHPVAAFLRIEQQPTNSILRLPTLQAFAALQPSLPPAMAHDENSLDMQVSIVSRAIAAAQVYRLGCRPDAEAAHLSHSTIYGNDND